MIEQRSRGDHKHERLNLVPIMDAVFIFIFFLLFSAQFIKIFEIETHAPIVSSVPSDKKLEDEPLNLVIKIKKGTVEVFTGIDPALKFKIFLDQKNAISQLKSEMINLRRQYPKDDEAIVSPIPSIRYKTIVKVIDGIQYIPQGMKVEIEKKGEVVPLKKIYSNVVLEPLDNEA